MNKMQERLTKQITTLESKSDKTKHERDQLHNLRLKLKALTDA